MDIEWVNKFMLSDFSRKAQGWLGFIFITLALVSNVFNIFINGSIPSLIAFIFIILIWGYVFYIYGGITKYASFCFGSKIEVDIHKWYDFNLEDREYQKDIMAWLAENKIKYYKNYGSTFYFLNKRDHMAFKLRWIE